MPGELQAHWWPSLCYIYVFDLSLKYVWDWHFKGSYICVYIYTVWCCYNTVKFLQNIHKRHPIARPLGRGMGCILWVQTLIDILPPFLQWCAQYYVILDRAATALNCISQNLITCIDNYCLVTAVARSECIILHMFWQLCSCKTCPINIVVHGL